MKRIIVTALLGSIALTSAAPAADAPLAPLSRLAGHCWKGEFAEGGTWDRHCFEWAYDGKFLHDKHALSGKRAPYGGETFYRYDAKAQRIVFHYFNSDGGYSEGDVQPAQDELRFPEERYEQGGKTMVLRTIWRFEDETKMLAVTEQQRDGKWVESWRVTFAHAHPASGLVRVGELGRTCTDRPDRTLPRDVPRGGKDRSRRGLQRHHD